MKKEELQTFDGKDGRKCYVSYEGKVYDVTESKLWKLGKHVNKHFAGMDLTEALKLAPHGADRLEKFPVVGTLDDIKKTAKKDDGGFKETVRKLYRLFHPHPMLIHFPMGLINFTVIMQIIFFATGNNSFETAGFYSLVTALVFLVPTIAAGTVSWWVNYALVMNKIFAVKIIFSIVLFFMLALEVIMRAMSPDIASAGGAGIFYNILLFANVPVLAVVGFNGGKLSWG